MDMEQNGSQNLSPPVLCRMGCGFYGSSTFDGMCSKCYKDTVSSKQQDPSPVSTATTCSTEAGSAVPSVTPVSATPVLSTSTQATSGGGGELATSSPPSAIKAVMSALSQTSIDGGAKGGPVDTGTLPNIETATPTVPVFSTPEKKLGDDETEDGAASAGPSVDVSSPDTPDDSQDKKTPRKNRCHTCKKKVGLTGFLCRCGGLYCSLHRYSDKHECSFDYKEMAQEQIRKNNPIVVGSKIQKI